MNAARAYARATSETASKERLMVLLFEAALRHMRVAAGHLDAKNVIEALPLLTKASDIVTELAATLNPQAAPELSQTLGEVYLFVAERLAVGAVSKDARAVREAERAFAPVVEGFQQAVASLAGNAVEAR
jgi:flagellar protein FliS